jgi:hypothetical protein
VEAETRPWTAKELRKRDLWGAHLGRMPLAVEENVAADPSDVGLLGAATAVAEPIGLADLVEQPGRAQSGRAGFPRDEKGARPTGIGRVLAGLERHRCLENSLRQERGQESPGRYSEPGLPRNGATLRAESQGPRSSRRCDQGPSSDGEAQQLFGEDHLAVIKAPDVADSLLRRAVPRAMRPDVNEN